MIIPRRAAPQKPPSRRNPQGQILYGGVGAAIMRGCHSRDPVPMSAKPTRRTRTVAPARLVSLRDFW